MTKTKLHPEFQCFVNRVEYDFHTRTGIADIPGANCTGMDGAIKFFKRIDRRVRRNITIAGGELDIEYVRESTLKWTAVDRTS